ncbi:MAG: hypothetical protein IPI89_13035 [Propionivibrio sp.]|nr:hypothetical protein [Propionivibrio sp.]
MAERLHQRSGRISFRESTPAPLRHLQNHLGYALANPASLPNLEGGVIWSCLAALERQPNDYSTRAAWAELTILNNPPGEKEKAWREAVAVANKAPACTGNEPAATAWSLRDLEFRTQTWKPHWRCWMRNRQPRSTWQARRAFV